MGRLKKCGVILFTLISIGLYVKNFCISLTAENSSTRSSEPKRIISLGPYITEELYLLGVEDRLIGNTIFCNRPEDAENKPKVSSAVLPNVEKIVSLKPDLILATSLIDKKAVKKLKNLRARHRHDSRNNDV